MGRVGQNPARWAKEVHHPNQITVTTAVHIPSLDGYWAEGLDVLKLCLRSIRESTEIPFDLVVFDNGSCDETRQFLLDMRRQETIQYLVLSQANLGKVGAWNFLFGSAPGDVVVYTDSDVLFLPKWLEKSLEVLKAFPEAGMVTAQPARRRLLHCSSTLAQAQHNASLTVRRGDLIPESYVEACRRGLGRLIEEYRQIIHGQEDVLLSRGEAQAFVSADHFQFLTTKPVLEALIPFKVTRPLASEDDYQMDAGVDAAGFWRLSTTDYLVHHLGNRLPTPDSGPEWLPLSRDHRPVRSGLQSSTGVRSNRLLSNRHVRAVLKRVNALTYRALFQN